MSKLGAKDTKIKIGVILAGGKSRRMGGADKAEFIYKGERLIDQVYQRIKPQVDHVVLSGWKDYGTGLAIIPDDLRGPRGPVGGIISVSKTLAITHPKAAYFYTVPVDAPIFPHDLIARLGGIGGPAIASSPSGLQPTFGAWSQERLLKACRALDRTESMSLKKLAEICGAAHIHFEADEAFLNINRAEDAV